LILSWEIVEQSGFELDVCEDLILNFLQNFTKKLVSGMLVRKLYSK